MKKNVIEEKRWGCTLSDIPWRELGYESRKLEYLLLRQGWFFDGHRASADCLATLWLLIDHPEAFGHLLEAFARRTTEMPGHDTTQPLQAP